MSRSHQPATASATTATLSLVNVQAGDAGNYDVVVTNSLGSVASSAAALTVAAPPSILSQPGTYTALAGQNAIFVVNVAGTGPFGFQWRKNGQSLSGAVNANAINGNTSSQLSVFAVSSADAGTYDVVVTSQYGSVTSNGAAGLFVVTRSEEHTSELQSH